MLEREIFGNTVAAWLFAICMLFVGMIVARIISGILSGIANRTKRAFFQASVLQLRPLISALGVIIGLRVGFSFLTFGVQVNTIFSRGFAFLVVLFIVAAIVRLYDVFHQQYLVPYAEREDTGIDSHLLLIFRIFARTVIWILGVGSALNSAGFDVTAIIAGLGIGGLAIALASQDTVSNIFGGLIILTQRPFKVGDRIKVAGQNGWVHDIGLRVTSIDNWYGRRITIPNKIFTDTCVENIDAQACYYENLRVRLEFGTNADYVERAMAILNEIILECRDTDDFFWMGLDGLVNGMPEIDIWYAVSLWRPDEKEVHANWYSKVVAAKTYLNINMMRRFEAEGLRFALPLEARIPFDTKPKEMPKLIKEQLDYKQGRATGVDGKIGEPPG